MEFDRDFSVVSPEITELSRLSIENGAIDPSLYKTYNVKRGLRDSDGKGVLTGLTELSEVTGHIIDENGNRVECEGILRYRGYNVQDIIAGTA
ncbi:MAG: citrate synthase, partial [Acutalibacteraceae bacterium]